MFTYVIFGLSLNAVLKKMCLKVAGPLNCSVTCIWIRQKVLEISKNLISLIDGKGQK